MKTFVEGVEQALDAGNYVAALVTALTLPDICSKYEYPDILGSSRRYPQWFDRFVRHMYAIPDSMPGSRRYELKGHDCYALRCSLLHEGRNDFSHQSARRILTDVYFYEPSNGMHIAIDNGTGTKLRLHVDRFCRDMLAGVNDWLATNPEVPKLFRIKRGPNP